MLLALLLFFIAIPLLELALLIKLAGAIGFWPMLATLLTAALAGLVVMQQQGIAAMGRAMEAVAQGRPPVEPVVDGAFILLAGGLLILPGLISDALGIMLLIPPLRRFIARKSFKFMLRKAEVHVETFEQHTTRSAGSARNGSTGGTVIEGEYTRVDEAPRKPEDPRER